MLTYQDLLAVGDDDRARAEFCYKAVNELKGSQEYQEALEGERYYSKHNTTIEQYQKWLYTMTGRKVPDLTGANHKLKTTFFRRLTIQQVQYVLGNGLIMGKPENKEKLGKDFDFKLQTAAKRAMAGGRAFGFWNLDHLEVFGYPETPLQAGFCPLYDENTSELKAGIRFWSRVIGKKLTRWYTLYEEDGYTEYSKREGDEGYEMTQPKQAYKRTVVSTIATGTEKEIGENYGSLPIIPLYANDCQQSELVGIHEKIDAYDLIESGYANTIDDTAAIYWVIKNSGGMDDTDVARFLQRIKDTHGAAVEDGEVEAHTVDIPVQAREALLERLRKEIYEDFGALDVNSLSAAQKTTQEIQAAYQAQDNKCADFEYFIIEFVQRILELAGIDDDISFNWNRVVNQAEQTSMILNAAQFLSREMVIKKLPFLTPEEAEQVIAQMDEDDYKQFTKDEPEDNPDDNPDDDEEEAE